MKFWQVLIPIIAVLLMSSDKKENVIIDSDMTFEQAVAGSPATKEIIESLTLLDVYYYSFDSKLHKGQLVVSKSIANEVKTVFDMIRQTKFPVNKAIPIVKYKWDDDASMSDNNSSSFCWRTIAGTNRISLHGRGMAVDINPRMNPVIHKDGSLSPTNGKYDTKKQGTFTAEHPIVKKFKELGWRWGGEFNSYKDNHHFDKPTE